MENFTTVIFVMKSKDWKTLLQLNCILRKVKIGQTLIDYVEENIKRINLTRRIFNN